MVPAELYDGDGRRRVRRIWAAGCGFGRFGRGGGTWSRDYPKADRQFLIALNRLTRINGRSTEQVVSLDSDDIFNYPFVYAVMVQTWTSAMKRRSGCGSTC